jgi:hypothetical protein
VRLACLHEVSEDERRTAATNLAISAVLVQERVWIPMLADNNRRKREDDFVAILQASRAGVERGNLVVKR